MSLTNLSKQDRPYCVKAEHFVSTDFNLINVNRYLELYDDRISKYEDIFGQIEKQERIVRLYERIIFKTREDIFQL